MNFLSVKFQHTFSPKSLMMDQEKLEICQVDKRRYFSLWSIHVCAATRTKSYRNAFSLMPMEQLKISSRTTVRKPDKIFSL